MSGTPEKMTVAKGTEKTWHGEENITDTKHKDFNLKVWAKDAGIDWSVYTAPLYTMESDEEADRYVPYDGMVALKRDSDNRVLSVVSPTYNEVQPADMLDFLNVYIEADERFQWSTAGSLHGGRKLFATACFHEDIEVLGERHKPFLLASTSFDGSLATTIGSTMTRVVCQNTLRMALSSKETATLRYTHRTAWTASHVAKAHKELEQLVAAHGHYKKMAEALYQHKLSKDAVTKFLTSLMFTPQLVEIELENGKTTKGYSKPTTRMANNIDRLIKSYEDTINEGTEKGTAWTVLNAVTRYVDHDFGTRMTSGRKADGDTVAAIEYESKTFGAGDRFKQAAIDKLLKVSNVNVKDLVAA